MGSVADKKSFNELFAGSDAEETFGTSAAAPATTVEFTIKKFILQNMLEKAAHVISPRDVMPVLKNFQFEVNPGRLRVVASDLELSLIATTEIISVDQPGTAVFPTDKMLRIVREAQAGDAHILVRRQNASITVGPTTWNLKLQGGYDFPAMPEISDATFAVVDRAAFTGALHAVRYAACKEAERASLMMVDVTGGKMTACDGSRIQQAAIGELPFDFQIPIGAVDDLLKLLKGLDLATISIGQSANHLIFKLGVDVFIANKLVAQFPPMEKQLLRPALENKHELTVDREDLVKAIRRVRITADSETSAIGLRIAPDRITVVARDKYGNDATETIDAGWSHGNRTVVVNHQFLTEMLGGYDRKECSFWLGDDTKTRKTCLLLKDPHTGTVGLVQQMLGEWVGA